MIYEDKIIRKYSTLKSLKSYDTKDIWLTPLGLNVKTVFYKSRKAGGIPAGLLTVADFFFNRFLRVFYTKREYPMVRAFSALSYLEIFKHCGEERFLLNAKNDLEWLKSNYSKGYSGYCWGMGAKRSTKNGIYPQDIPYTTNTPYILEAFVLYDKLSSGNSYKSVIASVFDFLEKDILIQQETGTTLALSYAPFDEPLTVINSNAYCLYMYALLLDYLPGKADYIKAKIIRLYNFIKALQNQNGSWLYYAEKNYKGNFLDCFHSCFVLKNLFKSSFLLELPDVNKVISDGYGFIKNNFFDSKKGLYKTFVINDKPSLIAFDLYDNAEMLNLMFLMNDNDALKKLNKQIEKHFFGSSSVYSQTDMFGFKHYKDTLRWAVFPYIYSRVKCFSCL